MAFYTPSWVRNLVKQDHKFIQEYVSKKDNDFRKYVDNVLPFTLYLDIGEIKSRILDTPETLEWITELASATYVEPQVIYDSLLEAYKNTINAYAENPRYIKVSVEELEAKLQAPQNAAASGADIKAVIAKEFKNTLVVEHITKKNSRVMLIFPKFATLKFGDVFKENFDYSRFSDYIDDRLDNSPRNLIRDFLNKNFGRLQNVGHIEVDVFSGTENKVKRGQNSPRLLQALVASDKLTNMQRLQRNFSVRTGQQKTRLKVRKNFSDKKLVFEMLVEYGMSVGLPETQKTNLEKAALEKAFDVGAGLTAAIRKDKNLLINLETSKSIAQYIRETVEKGLRNKPTDSYKSSTTIDVTTKITRQVLKPVLPKGSTGSTSRKRLPKGEGTTSLSGLQALLDTALYEQIKRNMGSGNRKDVLNFRTGRLARSAKVERLSQSRQGMITAFYSYMKNPYATFSAGGRQQYPRSRDPKLLISTSIREIAAKAAYTKMRSVLV